MLDFANKIKAYVIVITQVAMIMSMISLLLHKCETKPRTSVNNKDHTNVHGIAITCLLPIVKPYTKEICSVMDLISPYGQCNIWRPQILSCGLVDVESR